MENARGAAQGHPPARAAVDMALDRVFDPELDESILKLGFVESVEIAGAEVCVTYRLPTYWCAPNFAYMMAADIRAEVGQVPGVGQVRVLLRDHCAEQEITAGVNQGRSFREAFPGEATDELDDLRRKFWEKSFLARQEVLIRRLRAAGLSDERIVAMAVDELSLAGDDAIVAGDPPLRVRLAGGDLRKYLHRRASLLGEVSGLLFTDLANTPLRAEELMAYLRRSRMARISIAFNTSLCEGLLRTRYEPERAHETASLGDALLTVPTT